MAINVNVNGNTAPLEAAVQAAVNRIRRTPIKITVDDKGATQPLGNMRRSADEFSKSMEAANARIIAFGASMAIINGVADAFKGMVKNVVEVEKALADINVVMGLSAQNLERFSDGLFTVAKETGQAFKIAADAATEYARQGLSMEESLKRTKDALILTRLTGMDSANAVKSLTAAMNTYGNQIKDTTQLVSKFAAVDVKFAVSAEDFADAIARTGAAAKGAGVDIDELIGLVTAAQQQTARGGKVIGNSFKTIFTRIGRTDTLNQLENLGIAVRDVEGNTLGAKRILTDLANTFDNLTEAQKAQIAQTVGGVFQINVLKAVLGDAAKQNGILANATQISAGATDEAITKNEQLRLTMAAMATETGLAIKEVSAKIGEIALAPGMEKILNVVKSVAEGANNLLGDGESAGGKFANGFLKGLGNIITGPGLVVIVAVFGKLFLKAAQYARESLASLIGVTTEAQKQKAIQTSLVGLFGQNAALSKEMLRTDISRTEKEKIILALLKAQVAEANVLNAVSKQAASTLYRQGFGANLAPRGRSGSGGGRAGGHVPNFAEREQAAKGGYAAGNIREMSIPGQGSVIYNSAEKVKNFAGMKQPAIMPPLSSKAGKNYQQAFGSVHGFDPYAGSGFVPNFNKPKQKISTASGPQLNGINFAHMLTPGGGSSTVRAKPENSIYGVPVKDLPYVRFKKFGIRKDASVKAENKKKDIAEQIEEAVTRNATRQGVQLINSFKLGTGQKANASDVRKKLTSGASGASGAISSVVGALFEAAISTKIRQVTKKGFEQSGGIKGVAQGLGGDFDLRGPLGDGQKNDLKLMFGGSWSSTDLADYKSTDSTGNQKSMAEKILKEKIFRLGGRKTNNPALAFVKERMPQLGDKNKRVLGPRRGPSGRGPRLNGEGYIPNYAAATLARFGLGVKSKFQMAEMIKNSPFKHQLTRYGHWKNFPPDVKKRFNKYLLSQGLTNKTLQSYGFLSKNSKSIAGGLGDFLSADGHVPNFANPLADAVNREKGAGVPVSQIRVGSHQALMNKGNPLGLGVTNTTDEPNGLRDVFGANGYVPNYFINKMKDTIAGSSFGKGFSEGADPTKLPDYQALTESIDNLTKNQNSQTKDVKKLRKQLQEEQKQGKSNLKTKRDLDAAEKKLERTTRRVETKTSQRTAVARNAGGGFAGFAGRASGGMGRMFSGNAGMMMMMGAPMAAGFLQGDGPGQTGDGATAYAAGGALTGAASGGMMASMIAPFFGPAAPLIIGVGALTGALQGMNSATEENTAALRNKDLQRQQEVLSAFGGSDPRFLNDLSNNIFKDLSSPMISAIGRSAPEVTAQRPAPKFGQDTRQFIADLKIPFLSPMFYDEESANKNAKVEDQLDKVREFLPTQRFQTGKIRKGLSGLGDEQYMLPTYSKNDEGKIVKGDEGMQKASDYLKSLEDIDFFKAKNVEDFQRIDGLRKHLFNIYEKSILSETERAKGVIIQLDLQKTQIMAQQAAAIKQLEIKDRYSEISDNLQNQVKLAGSLATDQFKAQNKYLQALNKAEQAYAQSAETADSQLRMGILTGLKQNESMQSVLKTSLGLKGGASFQDITDQVGSLSGEELKDKLQEIASNDKTEGPIRKAILDFLDLEIIKRDNILDSAKKQQTSSKSQADREKNINMILADRKTILDDLKRADRMADENTRSAQKIRGFNDSVAKARRLNAVGAGFQSAKDKERFQILEKEFELESKLATLEENKASTLRELNIKRTKNEQEGVDTYKSLENLYNKEGRDNDDEMQIASLEGLEAQRIKNLEEIEAKIKNTNIEHEGEIESLKIKLALEKERVKQDRLERTGPGSFGRGFDKGMGKMKERIEYMDYELAESLPQKFADGLSNAMIEAINGAKDLDDALREAGLGFLKMIQQAMMQKLAMQAVSALGFSQGGGVRKYSSGGNVPAMVTNGEYVMGRSAAKKYGGGFMHSLNARGKVPNYSMGGDTMQEYGMGKIPGYRKGGNIQNRKFKEKQMSGFFYSGQSGNLGLREASEDAQQVVSDRMEAIRKAKAEAERKKQRRRERLGLGLSIVGMGLINHAMSGGFSDNVSTKHTDGVSKSSGLEGLGGSYDAVNSTGGIQMPQMQSQNFGDFNSPFQYEPRFQYESRGGKIGKYAGGGMIHGKSGIDQIPAMLSEGEYVIKASSARQLGKPMLDQINAGRFFNGGEVSKMDESESSSLGGNTNNINISVNVEKGQEKSQESESSGDPDQKEQSDDQNQLLAQKIKQQVVAVIVEEQRPGGLLND